MGRFITITSVRQQQRLDSVVAPDSRLDTKKKRKTELKSVARMNH